MSGDELLGLQSGSTTNDDPKTRAIRDLNDRLRQRGEGGQVLITRGLASYSDDLVNEVLAAVRTFDAFTKDNDPWGEHDCAVLAVDPLIVLFKIDYYDPFIVRGSEDPSDPNKTRRVLTIMLAAEY